MTALVDFNQEHASLIKSLEGSQFQSICRTPVKLIKAGVFCEDSGIHRHSECEKDGRLLTGDIVATHSVRDWYDYKGHLNSRYNRVVLHLTFNNNLFNLRVRLQNGKRILTVLIGRQ